MVRRTRDIQKKIWLTPQEERTIASPLLEQIYSNRAENKRLSILRDTLLPKLMSGEINVSAIQL